MAALEDLKALCEEATCPICLEYFTNPVIIAECGHNFCHACLTRFWEEEDSGSFCPRCRETVQQRTFIPNQQLENVVEIAKKLGVRGQKRPREDEGVCEIHQEPLKLFCKDHETLICVVCDKSKEHESHKVIPLEEAFQESKDQICSSLKILRAEREKLLTYKASTEKASHYLLNHTEEERQKTVAEIRQIRQFLEDEEKILLAQMEEVDKEIARRRDEHVARLSREISSLENIIQELEEKCQESASESLQDIRRTLQRYEKKEEFHNPVAFPPELMSRIREFCDRKYRLQGVKKLFQANVTLDPDTAHPKLVLSEDRRSVRRRRKRQALPNNPERFDERAFVLGCEGFTAGSHFWEVTVGSEGDWAVGVARKSVRRKGTIDIHPSKGIWAVGKWNGQYRACDCTPLPLRQELKRIRVTLHYAEGKVVFSDVDTGVHICPYSDASFCGDTLLPFFHVSFKAHLTLSP